MPHNLTEGFYYLLSVVLLGTLYHATGSALQSLYTAMSCVYDIVGLNQFVECFMHFFVLTSACEIVIVLYIVGKNIIVA